MNHTNNTFTVICGPHFTSITHEILGKEKYISRFNFKENGILCNITHTLSDIRHYVLPRVHSKNDIVRIMFKIITGKGLIRIITISSRAHSIHKIAKDFIVQHDILNQITNYDYSYSEV